MKNAKKHIDIEALNYKGAGFSTPKNYFEGIETKVFAKINSDIPDNYFDSIEDKVFAKLASEKQTVKVISFKSRIVKRFIPILAAASLVLFIGLNFLNKSETTTFDSLEISDISTWLDSENNITHTYALGALLDTDDITTLSNTSTLEDIQLLNYLDNINLEDLNLNN